MDNIQRPVKFTCAKCSRTIPMEERIYKKEYEGHTLCISCRPAEKPVEILTEEELDKLATNCGEMLNEGMFSLRQSKDIEYIIISHRSLNSRNLKLVLENDELMADLILQKELQKCSDEIIGDYVEKVEKQNEEICRMQDEISRLRGENNHE